MKKGQSVELKNVVWREGDFYVAQCLNIDVSSFGKTKEEALENLQEALELYFEDASSSVLSIVDNPELVQLSVANA